MFIYNNIVKTSLFRIIGLLLLILFLLLVLQIFSLKLQNLIISAQKLDSYYQALLIANNQNTEDFNPINIDFFSPLFENLTNINLNVNINKTTHYLVSDPIFKQFIDNIISLLDRGNRIAS